MGLSNWGFIKPSPLMMLLFFSMVELLIYMDRSVFSSIVPVLKSSDGLNLSSSEAGLIGSIFILGFMVGSPLFAHFSQQYHPMFLMGIGLFVWFLAVMGSGLATNYWILIVARAFTGVGEASFISLAPPYINDMAPPHRRSVWLAIFYSFVNTGNAIGFIFGNYLRDYIGGWHWPLIIESLLMVPLIIVSFLFYKDPSFLVNKPVEKDSSTLETAEPALPLHRQIGMLLKNKVYIILVLSFAAYIFTYGGWIFWGTDFMVEVFGLSIDIATVTLAAITFVCGICGSLTGAWIIDKKMQKIVSMAQENVPEIVQSKHRNLESNKILAVGITLGAISGVTGVAIGSFIPFIICFCISEYFQLMASGTIGISLMTCVPNNLRGQAIGFSVLVTHLLGDFPSPYVIGMIGDLVSMQMALIILMSWLLLASLGFIASWYAAVSYIQKNILKRYQQEELPFNEVI